ncbi:hypothetical protein ABW20_dc0103527 [Dactylellina cionopaga]|nr:hypothetical protein ABW20_dc0103527 [Dactylellina cionopaga]
MTSSAPRLTSLQSRAQDPEVLFCLPDAELLRLVHDDFSSELDRLKRAYSVRNQAYFSTVCTPSPSQILYGEEFDEINRTLVGLFALRWIYNNDYATFVGTQPDAVKLSEASFAWLRDFLTGKVAPTRPTDLYALITSIVINDLGKDPQLARDYCTATGEDISALNHDMILLKAVEANFVGCMDRLTDHDKTNLVCGMELGSMLNFGQLAQAESTPACLAASQVMKGHEHAFRLHFMEQLLDLAGAAGHMDWTCGRKLTEPIFQAYRDVYDVTLGVILEKTTLREGYDIILVRRAELLRSLGFRDLHIEDPKDRAFTRVLCMGNVVDLETARMYAASWASLDDAVRQDLVRALNVDGAVGKPAVQPTYMPAFLAEAVGGVTISEDKDAKAKALQSSLRFLTRIMTEPEIPSGRETVIERSVLGVLKEIVQSEGFRSNPGILDAAPVPDTAVAMMG